MNTYTAVIEHCPDTNELNANLREVIAMLLEDGEAKERQS